MEDQTTDFEDFEDEEYESTDNVNSEIDDDFFDYSLLPSEADFEAAFSF